MARLFEDGFDHYGLDEGNLLDNVYATANPDLCDLSTAFAATGTHSMYINEKSETDGPALRRVLPSAKDKMGVTFRLYCPSLPAENTSACPVGFQSSDQKRSQIACFIDSNGCFRFHRGIFIDGVFPSWGTQVGITDPLVTSGAWNHIEIQVYIHDTDGWIRLAVNGVHRYQATGLDTKYDTNNIVSVAHFIQAATAVSGNEFYIDDLIYYDFTGTAAVDTDFCPTVDGGGVATNYIGELQVMWLYANADTADEDWTPSTGSDSYAMVGKTTPDDATYISSATATDLSEFDQTDLPVEITYIRGFTIWARLAKSDAGAAMIKLGMESTGDVSDSAEFPITVEPSYYREQINVDPDTSSRWTRTSLNAADLRITRSA